MSQSGLRRPCMGVRSAGAPQSGAAADRPPGFFRIKSEQDSIQRRGSHAGKDYKCSQKKEGRMCERLVRRLGPAVKLAALILLLGLLVVAAHWARRPDPAWGALHRAARQGDAESIAALLGQGCDVNALDLTGATPLHAAAMSGDLESIDLLLDCGAD